jgi:hypothetical protein
LNSLTELVHLLFTLKVLIMVVITIVIP